MIGVSGGGGRVPRLRRRWVGVMQTCRRLQLAGRAGIVEESPVPTSKLILAAKTEARTAVGQRGGTETRHTQEGRRRDRCCCDFDVTVCDMTRFHGHARLWRGAHGGLPLCRATVQFELCHRPRPSRLLLYRIPPFPSSFTSLYAYALDQDPFMNGPTTMTVVRPPACLGTDITSLLMQYCQVLPRGTICPLSLVF